MPKRNSGSVRRRRKARALRDAWLGVAGAWLQDAASWDRALGPPPNEAGCLCPAGVLAEFEIGHAARSDCPPSDD